MSVAEVILPLLKKVSGSALPSLVSFDAPSQADHFVQTSIGDFLASLLKYGAIITIATISKLPQFLNPNLVTLSVKNEGIMEPGY